MTSHLGAGSKDVPIQDGKIRLYSMRFCPYAQRTHLVLNAKNIPHDVVNINLKSKPDWFLERNTSGKVPAVAIDGDTIYESLITCDYLDEKYPQVPLYPKDPWKKAKDRILIEDFTKVRSLLYKCYLAPKLEAETLLLAFDELDAFEKELIKRGSIFFCGDKPGMVDYMIWPWCERLGMLKVIGGDSFAVPKERFPKILSWCKAMVDDDAVKKHYLSPEQHAKFLQSFRAGTPDYDNII